MRLLYALLLVGVVAIAGCGSGPLVTQTRDVAPFASIAVQDSIDVDVVPGASEEVEVTAGENVIERVETETRDGVLHVDVRDRGIVIGKDPFHDLRVRIPAGALDRIRVSGAGDVHLGRIDTEELALEIEGSGDIDGSGRVDRLVASIEGAGDANLFDLEARTARVSVEGAGDLELNVSERLDVTVEGSGDVSYRGNPAVNQRVEGAGEVSQDG
jgi:hypothetical protein